MAEAEAGQESDGEAGRSGLLLIDKPAGITSHDAVNLVRRVLGTRKVGHAGTLDPLATGLLLMGVGRATRLLRFLGELPKVYQGVGLLGVETTTLDAEGDVVRRSPVDLTERELRAASGTFIGDIEQVPPAYSAVKVGGRKLYEAARKGNPVQASPRRVRVDAIGLTEDEARAATHGSILGPAGIEGPYLVLGPEGRLIGIYSDRGAKAVPEVILS